MSLPELINEVEKSRRSARIDIVNIEGIFADSYKKILDQAAADNLLLADVIQGKITFQNLAERALHEVFFTRGLFYKRKRDQIFHRLWNLEWILGIKDYEINPNDDSSDGWFDKDWFKDLNRSIPELAEDFTLAGRVKANVVYLGSAVTTGVLALVPVIFGGKPSGEAYVITAGVAYGLLLGLDAITARTKANELRNNALFFDKLIQKIYEINPAKIPKSYEDDPFEKENSVDGFEREAQKLIGNGSFYRAKVYAQRSLEKNPRNLSAMLKLAYSCWMLEEYNDAINHAKQALYMDPFNIKARIVLYSALIMQQKFDELFKDYEQLPQQLKDDKQITDERSRAYFSLLKKLEKEHRVEELTKLRKQREEYVPLESLLRLDKELKPSA